MSKKTEVVLRCLDHYINYFLEKQKENKKRGFPGIINEDIEKKIEGLNALKQTWNPPSEDKKIDMKYYKLFSDSLINYRQELLKSIDLAQGDVQGLKDPFLETELELKLIEEVRRVYNME
jgi:hypothetical protein